MKRQFTALAFMAAFTSTTAIGCASASSFWNELVTSPVTVVTTFEQSAQTALNIATLAWNVISPLIPASALPEATSVFNSAMLVAQNALTLLNDALKNLENNADAGSATNLNTQMQAVSDSVEKVVAVISQYQTSTVAMKTSAHPNFGMTELNAAVVSMKRIGSIK